jgi:hypothetical protein
MKERKGLRIIMSLLIPSVAGVEAFLPEEERKDYIAIVEPSQSIPPLHDHTHERHSTRQVHEIVTAVTSASSGPVLSSSLDFLFKNIPNPPDRYR